MRTPLIAACLFPALLLGFRAELQEGARSGRDAGQGKGEEEQEVDWRTHPALRAEHYREELQGAWQLTRAKRGNESFVGSSAAGYAIFAEGYMAIELHVKSNIHMIDTDGTFFQTGIHRWQIDSFARLETFSLIGTTSFTDDEEVEFEPRGIRREYDLVLGGDQLTMRRTDGRAELSFQRLGRMPFPSGGSDTDFFGRKKR